MKKESNIYYVQDGFLIVGTLLSSENWVRDEVRSHCTVCVQQFFAFKRRHHCRTCGEVVCSACSKHRRIRLAELHVECTTRICTFCMMQATDASINITRLAFRRKKTERSSIASTARCFQPHQPQTHLTKQRRSNSSIDSEFTNGSIMQLWPSPVHRNETKRLAIAKSTRTILPEDDGTLHLLVNIVSKSLACPVTLVGILDKHEVFIQASVGWAQSHLPREDCVCAHTLTVGETLIVPDARLDMRFHATTDTIEEQTILYYAGAPIKVYGHVIGVLCALDIVPHLSTNSQQVNTLEAISKIISEVLEQRAMEYGTKPCSGSSEQLQQYEMHDLLPKESTRDSTHDSTNQQQQLYEEHHTKQNFMERKISAATSNSSSNIDSIDDSYTNNNRSLQYIYEDRTVVEHFNDKEHTYRLSNKSCQNISINKNEAVVQPMIPLATHNPEAYFDEKLDAVVDHYQQLLRSTWEFESSVQSIDQFTLNTEDVSYLKASCVLTHSNNYANALQWKELVDIQNIQLYQSCVESVKSRRHIDSQTTLDSVAFRSEVMGANQLLSIISYHRLYPNGSRIYISFLSGNMYNNIVPPSETFYFGWFLVPNEDKRTFMISCISKTFHFNTTLQVPTELLKQFKQQSQGSEYSCKREVSSNSDTSIHSEDSTYSPVHLHSEVSSVGSSIDLTMPIQRQTTTTINSPNQASMATDRNISSIPMNNTTRTSRYSYLVQPSQSKQEIVRHSSTVVVNRSRAQSCGVYQEKALLTLLDRAIGTQQMLVAQQSNMMCTLKEHGSQLTRLSEAVDRVENLLQVNPIQSTSLPNNVITE